MIAFETLLPVLGKPLRSPAIAQLLTRLGHSPELESMDEERSYASFPDLGLDWVIDAGIISALQFFGDTVEPGRSPYRGTLPHALSFDDSRAVVLNKLGQPVRSHAGVDDPRPFVRVEPWVKYHFGTYTVHCNFSMDASRTKLITVRQN